MRILVFFLSGLLILKILNFKKMFSILLNKRLNKVVVLGLTHGYSRRWGTNVFEVHQWVVEILVVNLYYLVVVLIFQQLEIISVDDILLERG